MNLTSAEVKYLLNPFSSDAEELLQYQLKELCLKKVLEVEQRWIKLHPRERRRRARFFFKKGENFSFENLSKAEAFLLTPFTYREEVQLYQLRNHIAHGLKNDVGRFKSRYVYHDLKTKGLCVCRFFLTEKGRFEKRSYADMLRQVNANATSWLHYHPEKLITAIDTLRGSVLLLEGETLNQLEKLTELPDLPELGFTSLLRRSYGSFDAIESFSLLESFSIGGDFDGFGGGDFGGGGAIGDW